MNTITMTAAEKEELSALLDTPVMRRRMTAEESARYATLTEKSYFVEADEMDKNVSCKGAFACAFACRIATGAPAGTPGEVARLAAAKRFVARMQDAPQNPEHVEGRRAFM